MAGPILVGGVSRSGTTLLCTILDAHPRVAMGYELLPTHPFPAYREAAVLVERSLSTSGGGPRQCGNALIADGKRSLGQFVKRCGRAGVEPAAVVEVLRAAADVGLSGGFQDDVRLCSEVVERKRLTLGADVLGFKLNTPRLAEGLAALPGARLVAVIRDPSDVVASRKARGFRGGAIGGARGWSRYARAARDLAGAKPNAVVPIRYEALVTEPEPVLRRLFERLDISWDPIVLRFFASEATIHSGDVRHANADALQRDFFTTSIGRHQHELRRHDRALVRVLTIRGRRAARAMGD